MLFKTNYNIENRNVSKILNYFFEDLIYKAKSKNGRYSPEEVINSDILLLTALKYIDNHNNFYQQKSDVANLRDFFFSSSMVGKVTHFNPVIARKIMERYIPFDNATIFDFSCGFGGRMLGVLSSKYKYEYIGVDPYIELYQRLLNFSQWICTTLDNGSKSKIYNLGSEVLITSLISKVDLSFSSPPYFNYEKYTDSNTQSYNKYTTYYEWIENYVIKTIENLFKYTKDGGLHLVNLEDTKRIKLIQDWIDISKSVGFNFEGIEDLCTLNRTSAKNKNKLLIFRK